MLYKFPLSVPTYNNLSDTWSYTEFTKMEEFREFLIPLFKEPGQYEFDETAWKFNEQARYFNHNKRYHGNAFPKKSKDYVAWWNAEKEKCTRGVIFINGKHTWYLTRDYNMWINFLKIYNKELNDFTFPNVMDVQYHMALYELLAELYYKHCPILKKRQIASSYFHCAKLINAYWFENGAVLKMGASREDYINLKGSWRFLNEYRDFLNNHTAWYRPNNPDKTLNWQQKIEFISSDGRKTTRGNKSLFTGTSFEKDATAGVGGPCTIFFHEEAGIAPKMGTTFSFMKPAMRFGHVTTGIFIAAGSVGELDKCKPLEEMILKPTSDFYTVKSNLLDENWTEGTTGLFIPEQWGMMPYVDEFGNSLVDEALKAIIKERELWKKEFTPEQYQYEISQHPINIKEAFAWRKEAMFPTHLVERRLKEIEAGEVFLEYLDIYRDSNGKPQFKPSKRMPNDYPVDKKLTDKRGCCVVHKRPEANPERGRYYASIDPVGEGKTTTSDSLFALTVYEMPVERTIHDENGVRIEVDGDKEVLSWVGRFDDINETHEWASLILEMYNAEAVVEANVSLFINYMILKRRHHLLVTSDQLVFNQEQKNKANQHHTFGWKNVGTLFKAHLISYPIEHCKEVINQQFDPEGNTIKTIYGVDRITTPRKLKEMLRYQDGVNVDELVAWTALIAFIKLQIANRGYKKVVEYKENLNSSGELYKLNYRTPFKNIGKPPNSSVPEQYRKRNNPFKNIR